MDAWMLARVVESLSDTYTPDGVRIYLVSSNRHFDMRTPLDLIEEGEGRRVLDEADRLAGGPVRHA